VGSSGSGVGVTRTPEDAKVVIARRGTEESMVRCRSYACSERKAVKEIGGDVQALCPKTRRKRRLEQKGAYGVISGANHALGLVVLGGGIRAGHAQLDAVGEKEGTGGGVIELTTIVTPDSLDGKTKPSRHPGEEVQKGGEILRLHTQGKSPRIVREIIDHHKIVFVARNAEDRRSP